MKVVAADQGTTGTKSFTLDGDGTFTPLAAFEHRQIYPQQGWVEHDPEELIRHVTEAIAAAGEVEAIGICHQGETVVAWDSKSGRPVYNAIVWQDSRTSDMIERLKSAGAEALVKARAGLPLDPYFSASKLRWIIDHVGEAVELRRQGRLCLGTSDSFFHFRLTGEFVTDVTAASRTSLMSLETFAWNEELCDLFGVPMECLPEIRPSAGLFGTKGKIPVTASLVDQQAALFGHGCAAPGDAKITFGTGAFALAVAGPKRLDGGTTGLLPTVAWRIGAEPPAFAMDGGVYNAASAVNWARGLGLFKNYTEIASFGEETAIEKGLVFVPALSGLACPHWDRDAAGLWIGMGLSTTAADLMQSLLEGVALRATEVMDAMETLLPIGKIISVDGGMSANPYFLQFLANALGRTVEVPANPDLTARGTAMMAMKGAGAENIPPARQPGRSFAPVAPLSRELKGRFAEALSRTRGWRRH